MPLISSFKISSVFSAVMDYRCKSSASGSSSPFDCIIFDLDDTLYSSKTGLGEAVKRNIDAFLVEKLGLDISKASTMRIDLFKSYGSSLAGLRALGYDISADDYHSVVHGRLPYEVIKPDSQLKNLLLSINQRKIIFTNSDRIHAFKVLDRLGIRECFQQIICFETMNPNLSHTIRPDEFPVVLKPSQEAIRIALEVSGVDPRRTLFLDDSPRNVAVGKSMGLRTVLVGKATKIKDADYALEAIGDLAKVIPEIWISSEDDDKGSSCTRTEMNSALATTVVGA